MSTLIPEYTGTGTLKEKGSENKFKNFLLPSADNGYKSTTIFSVVNSFGCTFHLCIEYFSEAEIIGRAQDWIKAVEASILNDDPALLDQNEFIKLSFDNLFPEMAKEVNQILEIGPEAIGRLPTKSQLKAGLSPLAKKLMDQRFHIFAGQGLNFYQDQLYIMKIFEDEIGIGISEKEGFELEKCFLIKTVRTFLPSLLLASGCKITDSPGTGDTGPLQKKVARDALREHNVVVAICEKSLNLAEETSDMLFKDAGPFSFTSNLLKDPTGKNLIVMHYVEKSDTDGKDGFILRGEFAAFKVWKKNMDDQSFNHATRCFEKVKKTLKNCSIPDLHQYVTPLTVFPNLFASLILRLGDHSCSEEDMSKMIECTDGHQLFALPEILGQQHWHRELSKFAESLKAIHDDSRQIAEITPFSDYAKERIKNLSIFCNAVMVKGRGAADGYKLLLDNIIDSGNTAPLKRWDALEVGDIIDAHYQYTDGRKDWWLACITKISQNKKKMTLAYLDVDGNQSRNATGEVETSKVKIKKSDQRNSNKEQRSSNKLVETRFDLGGGQVLALKLKEFSIDTALNQFEPFQRRKGLIHTIVDDYFQKFEKHLEMIVPKIKDFLEYSFRKLEPSELESDHEYQNALLSIFSYSQEGKYEILSLVDSVLKDLDGHILACFKNSSSSLIPDDLPFNFPALFFKLRHELQSWGGFIGDRIGQVFLQSVGDSEDEIARGIDSLHMKNLFDKFMRVGSKSLQDRLDRAFMLGGSKSSQYPDYDFLAENFRKAIEEEVKKELEEMENDNILSKKSKFISRVDNLMQRALNSVKVTMRRKFLDGISELKSDFSKKPHHTRFSHEFASNFLEKLNNTVNRSTDLDAGISIGQQKILQDVDEMLVNIPRTEDITADVFSNMSLVIWQRKMKKQIKKDFLAKALIRWSPYIPSTETKLLCLHHNFLSKASNIDRYISSNISALMGTDFEDNLRSLGFIVKGDVPEDPGTNTLWRALAQHFEGVDPVEMGKQLRFAVVDQILLSFSSSANKARGLLGSSLETFINKVYSGQTSIQDDEICLHFFLLCFGTCRFDAKSIKGINVWVPGKKNPKYHILSPASNEYLNKLYRLDLPCSKDSAVFPSDGLLNLDGIQFETRAIDIALYSNSDHKYSYIGIQRAPSVAPTITGKRKERDDKCPEQSQEPGMMMQQQKMPVESALGTALVTLGSATFDSIFSSYVLPCSTQKQKSQVTVSPNSVNLVVYLLHYDALLDFYRSAGSKKLSLNYLIDVLKCKQADSQRMAIIIPHLVNIHLQTKESNLKDPRTLLNDNKRKIAYDCSRLRELIAEEYTLYHAKYPSENIRFFVQDIQHWARTCNLRSIVDFKSILDSMFKSAIYLEGKHTGQLEIAVVVADEREARQVYNQGKSVYEKDGKPKFNMLTYSNLTRTYKICQKACQTSVWHSSFGLSTNAAAGGTKSGQNTTSVQPSSQSAKKAREAPIARPEPSPKSLLRTGQSALTTKHAISVSAVQPHLPKGSASGSKTNQVVSLPSAKEMNMADSDSSADDSSSLDGEVEGGKQVE